MNANSQRSVSRPSSFSLALAALGCSLGVAIPANAITPPPLDKPLSARYLKQMASQYKLDASTLKQIETGNDQLAALSLNFEQIKSSAKGADQQKLAAVQQKMEATRQQLRGIFLKFEVPDEKAAVQQKHSEQRK